MNGLSPNNTVAGPELVAQCISPEEALLKWRRAWTELALKANDATFFMFPAAFEAWYKLLSDDVDTWVIVVTDKQGNLYAVMPVMRATVRRGPAFVPHIDYAPSDRKLAPPGFRPFSVRQLSPVISWTATSLRPTFLCHGNGRERAIGVVSNMMASMGAVDEIVLPVIRGPDEGIWINGLTAAGLQPWTHQLGRNVMRISNVRPFDDIVADQKKKFRQNIRRARATANSSGLQFYIHQNREEVGPFFDVLARIAAKSWKGIGRSDTSAMPYEGIQRQFFERIFDDPNSGLTPVFAIVKLDQRPIAIYLNAVHGDTMTTLLTFRTDQAAKGSPGMLLLGHLIDWSAERGISCIDLNSTQSWVRYIVDQVDEIANIAAFRPTLRGRVFQPIAELVRRRRS